MLGSGLVAQQIIGGAIQVHAQGRHLPEVDLHRFAFEHFVGRVIIDAYLDQKGRRMQYISCH
jgi:hypothetical protein